MHCVQIYTERLLRALRLPGRHLSWSTQTRRLLEISSLKYGHGRADQDVSAPICIFISTYYLQQGSISVFFYFFPIIPSLKEITDVATASAFAGLAEAVVLLLRAANIYAVVKKSQSLIR